MLLILSVIISLSANSYFVIWIRIELRILVLIPLLIQQNIASINESALKYFLVQIRAGLIFLARITSISSLQVLTTISLIIKLGLFPFFIWIPHIFRGFSFLQIFILSTIQKISPIIVLSSLTSNLIIPIVFRILVGSIGGLFLTNLKKILAYSSVRHTGWLTALAKYQKEWMLYLVLYAILLLMLIKYLHQTQIKRRTQSLFIAHPSRILYFWTLIISLAGLPPFLGFYLKWLRLSILVSSFRSLIFILVLAFSFALYFYLSIIINNTLAITQPLNPKISPSMFINFLANTLGLIIILPII